MSALIGWMQRLKIQNKTQLQSSSYLQCSRIPSALRLWKTSNSLYWRKWWPQMAKERTSETYQETCMSTSKECKRVCRSCYLLKTVAVHSFWPIWGQRTPVPVDCGQVLQIPTCGWNAHGRVQPCSHTKDTNADVYIFSPKVNTGQIQRENGIKKNKKNRQ